MKTAPITSLLWRSLRAYQVFGANTDVGKTIFTTLLCKGTKKIWSDRAVTFLKPVSTGPAHEADTRCELRLSSSSKRYSILDTMPGTIGGIQGRFDDVRM